MIDILLWNFVIISVITIILHLRKVWYAPIFGVLQQIAWVPIAISAKDVRLTLVLSVIYSMIYIIAIPKWFRERKDKK